MRSATAPLPTVMTDSQISSDTSYTTPQGRPSLHEATVVQTAQRACAGEGRRLGPVLRDVTDPPTLSPLNRDPGRPAASGSRGNTRAHPNDMRLQGRVPNLRRSLGRRGRAYPTGGTSPRFYTRPPPPQ